MPGPRVYVETSVASFYHDDRPGPGIVARREWSRQWWERATDRYELVTSPAVVDELKHGIVGTWPTQTSSAISGASTRCSVCLCPCWQLRWKCSEGKMKPKQLPPDPVIDEIREIRHRISAEFDHDPKRLVAYYMELQKQPEYRDRLIDSTGSADRADQPAA